MLERRAVELARRLSRDVAVVQVRLLQLNFALARRAVAAATRALVGNDRALRQTLGRGLRWQLQHSSIGQLSAELGYRRAEATEQAVGRHGSALGGNREGAV